jgi:predicted nucleic acid-binding Zn ribbon protein
MSNASRRGPRPLSEILGDLFTMRGYGRLLARQELEDAWNQAVGASCCAQTRLGEVRRGVLNVTVAHSTLLEELAAFRKPALLEAMRAGAPATTIHDIRFRVGSVALEAEATRTTASGFQAGQGNAQLTHSGVRPWRTGQASRRKSSHSSGSNPVDPS